MANTMKAGYKVIEIAAGLTTSGSVVTVKGAVCGVYATAASLTPTVSVSVSLDGGTTYAPIQTFTLSTIPTYYPMTNLHSTVPFSEVKIVPSATLHGTYKTYVVIGEVI